MNEEKLCKVIREATDTYPELLENPVTKANFQYASLAEQAAYVMEKLLVKMKCQEKVKQSDNDKEPIPARKRILEVQNKLGNIAKESDALMDSIIQAQAKLIELQAKKLAKQKEEIALYKESESNLYDVLKEYMPVEDYEVFVTGEGT